MDKSPEAFRTISEVAEALDTPAHVLRFWETRFPQIRPVKRAGGRRYYRPSDLALLAGIRRLLHDEGMTIRGVQKILREQGVRHVAGLSDEASAEEEALISAMTTAAKPHETEVTRLTPREADQASIDALEAEARAAGPGEDGKDATVIAFPLDPSKETPVPATTQTATPMPISDPRQSMFPGFSHDPEPEDDLIAPVAEDSGIHAPSAGGETDADAPVEEAPFIFDLDHDDEEHASEATVTRLPLPETQPEAQPDPQPESMAEPLPEPAAPEASPTGDPAHTLAARIRALPPGRLNPRNEALRSLARRLAALRQSLGEACRQGA